MRRHVSPHDWISTLVSRPFTVVVLYGPPPPRTSRHTGALLPGWVTARSCCALMRSCSCGTCCICDCPSAAPAMVSDSKSKGSRIACLLSFVLLADALVFVLGELALLDHLFPARAIALGPFAAAQLRDRR